MRTLRLSLLGLLAFVTLGASAQENIAGTWSGTLAVAPGQELEVHFVLTQQAGGGYAAVVTSPNSDAIKNVAATDVSFTGGRLSLKVPTLAGAYDGTLKDGAFDGKWTQPGGELALALKPYAAPVLSQAAKDRLLGSWVAEFPVPGGGKLALVMRYEVDVAGELLALLDSPDQGARGLPLTDVMLDGDKLSWRQTQAQVVYTATLQDGKFVGTWTQLGAPTPLTFTKGVYTSKSLGLSDAAMAVLKGTWQGKLALPDGRELTSVYTFESPAAGQSAASLQVPEQGPGRIPATAATFDAGKVVVKFAAVAGEYQATVTGTTMTGTWTQGGMTFPLTLTKTP